MEGLVIKAVGGNFTVATFDNKVSLVCKPRGALAYKSDVIKVGDKVIFNDNERVIEKLLPKKNTLERPLVSNIDKMFVVTSLKSPEFNLYLLDKMLAIYNYYDITSVLLFTKVDLCTKNELVNFEKIINYYKELGYHVYFGNNKEFDNKVFEEIENNICAVSGQTGVGKSTFMNFLNPNLKQETNEISDALGRGKHTTRSVELFPFFSGWVADTPGFGNINFPKIDLDIISDLFDEFKDSRTKCKYNNCTHQNEPHCYIKDEVENGNIMQSRYDNYLRFYKEIKEYQTRY